MKFIIEHMEEGLSDWVKVEYAHMITNNTLANIPANLDGAECTPKTVLEFTSMEKVLLLDPASTTPLSPAMRLRIRILSLWWNLGMFPLMHYLCGDDPPKDRTKMLRQLGFATRHLGPIQMTTDTAVLVSHRILTGTPMEDLKFVDRPTVQLYKNESVEMPFRYLLDDAGKPIMPPGFIEVLKRSNDEILI
ncbi:SAM-dependent RNA methyltransferase [Chytridium lagenaria]|nr:SAM-dependent RNA methyltransferase [Chytridium lagenaria]